MAGKTFWLSLMLIAIQSDLSKGSAVLEVVSIAQTPPDDKLLFCVQYNYQYQHLPTSDIEAIPYELEDLSMIDGCDASEYNGHSISSDQTVVGVARGNCSFTQKAAVAESQGAAAILVVDSKSSTMLPVPGGNATDFAMFNITLAVISWEDYHSLTGYAGPVLVSLYNPPMPLWDGNMILIIFASTLIVMVGAGWAAHGEVQALKNKAARTAAGSSTGDNDNNSNETEEGADPFTVCGVIVWFIFICGTILLLYFFYDYMVFLFIALFCLVGAHSLYRCFLPAWTRIMPINYDIPLNRLPCFKSKAKLGSLLLLMPCLTLGIFWAVERHAYYAWVLQDILGIAFCICLIQTLRLPSLKIIGILLSLLLLYDVFFVFITPLFTSDGESVMVSVATGGRSQSKESLPMVFLIPLLGTSSTYVCRDRNYSLLGFGDVIVPGLLVAFNAICDVRLGRQRRSQILHLHRLRWWNPRKMPYFLTASAGYLIGMAMCMISLVLMKSGQPALLFLVPCTLVPTAVLALARGQFGLLFRGDTLLMVDSSLDEEGQSIMADVKFVRDPLPLFQADVNLKTDPNHFMNN